MVRITAAEALGRFGSDKDTTLALKVLLHYARPEANAFLSMAAWNALDYLDERAAQAEAGDSCPVARTDRTAAAIW